MALGPLNHTAKSIHLIRGGSSAAFFLNPERKEGVGDLYQPRQLENRYFVSRPSQTFYYLLNFSLSSLLLVPDAIVVERLGRGGCTNE